MADEKDDLSRIADKIMARGKALGMNPSAMPDAGIMMVSVESFNTLLADAQKLARFVLSVEAAKTSGLAPSRSACAGAR